MFAALLAGLFAHPVIAAEAAPGSGPAGSTTAGCDAVAYRVAEEHATVDRASGVRFVTPPNPDGPAVVDLGLFVVDVTDVDVISGTFTFEGFLDLVWCDPRLAFDSEATGVETETFITTDAALELEQIWSPDVLIANATTNRETGNQILELSADGTVEYQERFSATLEAGFDLRRFPFDHQTLSIVVESFAWSSEVLVFHEEGDKIGFGDEFEIPDWHTAAVRSHVTTKQEVRDRAPFSRFVLEIDVDRQSAFYVWKLLIPLVLLVAISWSVFWMDEESLADRMSVSLTGILTVVAFQFIISEDLPRISYLTFMDAVLFTSFAMMVLTIVENVLVTAYAGEGQGSSHLTRLDRTCRWLFPAAYAGLLTVLALAYLR